MSLFVGLDLHKVYSEFAVMDIFGNVLRQGRVENTLDKMKEFSESVPEHSSMVIESSSTWYWAHRLLSEKARRHPLEPSQEQGHRISEGEDRHIRRRAGWLSAVAAYI